MLDERQTRRQLTIVSHRQESGTPKGMKLGTGAR